MKRYGDTGFAVVVGILLLFILVFPNVASAQGCALCYQSVAAAGSRAIHALQNGIIVLIVPPFFICSAMTYLVYRRRNSHNENA
jgi:Mg2+/Co2+ transporter CorB